MAFIDPQKLKELFKKFEQGGEYNPGDGTSPEISDSDQTLLSDLISEYEKILSRKSGGTTGGTSSGEYFRNLLEKFKKDKEYSEKAGKYLEWDTQEASEVKKQIAQSQMSKIKSKIEEYAIAGELNTEAAKRAQEKYKLLKQEIDENDSMLKSLAKGESIAVSMTQSVLGVSNSFSGPDGIIGSIKGFGKGLKKTVNSSNILVAVFTKMFEQAKAVDEARAKLYQKTGLSGLTTEMMDIGQELASVYGPGSPAAAGEILADLQSEMKVFKDFRDSGEIVRMANMSGRLKSLGVSVTAMGSSYQAMSKGIGMDAEEMDHTVRALYKMGKDYGMTQKESLGSFAKTLPTYARFGKRAPQMFARLAATARATNVKIEDLMSLTEDLDTSENALKTAAKLNSLLGGSFVNGVALLAADASGKVRLIAEAYQRAEAQFGVPHQRVQRAMQGYLGSAGVSAENFQKIVRGQFADFDAKVANLDEAATDEEIKKDTEKTLDQSKRIDAAMAELIQKLNNQINKHMPAIAKTVGFLARHAKITLPALALAGMAVSAAYMKSKFDNFVRIPRMKLQIGTLKAQLAALKAASAAKGAASCIETAAKTAGSMVSSGAAGAVDDVAKGAASGLAGTVAGEGLEAVAKNPGFIAKHSGKIANFLKNSKLIQAIGKYPIVETLFAIGESAGVLMDDTLDVKGKARGVTEAVAGALGGWLAGWGLGAALAAISGGSLGWLGYMAGGFLGSWLGRLLARSAIGQGFADNVLMPILKSMGVEDGSYAQKLDVQQMKKSGMSPKDIARAKGEFVAEEMTQSQLMGFEDTLTAMSPVPMKKAKFENSKHDGVLLEQLDNLRKGLIKLRDIDPSVSLEVGSRVYAINGGSA